MIEIQGLVKAFPTATGPLKRAVDSLCFHVEPGEIYGLLGPNGAGKTTTLRILSGLMQPTEGRVLMAGVDVTREPERAKGLIGFLTANTGLYQRLSPRELLPYFAELHGIEPALAKQRVEELIGWLGMTDFADLRCGALSTGQKQRTNIARALIADPPVLILDEPTLGLDVLTNRVILEFIRRQRDRGKAILLSTHYLDEAENLCDRIGLLHEGRLIAEGTMPELRVQSGCERLTDIFLRMIENGSEGFSGGLLPGEPALTGKMPVPHAAGETPAHTGETPVPHMPETSGETPSAHTGETPAPHIPDVQDAEPEAGEARP
jgi:sodium transport system ATP-binding protein